MTEQERQDIIQKQLEEIRNSIQKAIVILTRMPDDVRPWDVISDLLAAKNKLNKP